MLFDPAKVPAHLIHYVRYGKNYFFYSPVAGDPRVWRKVRKDTVLKDYGAEDLKHIPAFANAMSPEADAYLVARTAFLKTQSQPLEQ